MRIDGEAGRQRSRIGQRVAGSGRGEVARGVEREGLAIIGGLIGNSGTGRRAVANRQIKALADRLTMGVGCRHGDWVAGGNGRYGERAVLFSPSCPVRSKGLDQLIAAVLVKY